MIGKRYIDACLLYIDENCLHDWYYWWLLIPVWHNNLQKVDFFLSLQRISICTYIYIKISLYRRGSSFTLQLFCMIFQTKLVDYLLLGLMLFSLLTSAVTACVICLSLLEMLCSSSSSSPSILFAAFICSGCRLAIWFSVAETLGHFLVWAF